MQIMLLTRSSSGSRPCRVHYFVGRWFWVLLISCFRVCSLRRLFSTLWRYRLDDHQRYSAWFHVSRNFQSYGYNFSQVNQASAEDVRVAELVLYCLLLTTHLS